MLLMPRPSTFCIKRFSIQPFRSGHCACSYSSSSTTTTRSKTRTRFLAVLAVSFLLWWFLSKRCVSKTHNRRKHTIIMVTNWRQEFNNLLFSVVDASYSIEDDRMGPLPKRNRQTERKKRDGNWFISNSIVSSRFRFSYFRPLCISFSSLKATRKRG